MIFIETKIKGVYVVDIEKIEDERGFFARTWCREEFKENNLTCDFVQCSISYNSKKGTLRGMHYQIPPFEEVKLVRVTSGAIYDVVLDIRPESPTFKMWYACVLNSENRKMIYIPEGVAHGFITLQPNTEIFYQISQFYNPEYSRGIRWNDPAFNIKWPISVEVISERDKGFPNFFTGKE